jgi:hypothetical protein
MKKLELSEEEEGKGKKTIGLLIQFYISERWKICNMYRPIPNSNGVLACATGDGLLLALLELTWYAPLHLHPTQTPYPNWNSII